MNSKQLSIKKISKKLSLLLGVMLFLYLYFSAYNINQVFYGMTKCGTLFFKNIIHLTNRSDLGSMVNHCCGNSFVYSNKSDILTAVPAWYTLSSELHVEIEGLKFMLTDFRREYISFNNYNKNSELMSNEWPMSILSLDLTKKFESNNSLLIRLLNTIITIDSAGWQRDIGFDKILKYPTRAEILKRMQNGSLPIMSWVGESYNIRIVASNSPYAATAELIITPSPKE